MLHLPHLNINHAQILSADFKPEKLVNSNEYLTSIVNMERNLRIKQQQRKVCVFLSYFPAFATAPEPAEDLKIQLGK